MNWGFAHLPYFLLQKPVKILILQVYLVKHLSYSV